MRSLFTGLVLLLALPAPLRAATEIRSAVFGTGGGSTDTPTLTLHSTLGQAVVDRVTTATHELHSGFWGSGPNTLTAVSPEESPKRPAFDRLHQNVPNPFNPTTSIVYELAEEGPVRLRVYDVAGRAVVTLVDVVQDAGRRSIRWRGDSADGTPVASGIYLFVLETSRARTTRKSVLLR